MYKSEYKQLCDSVDLCNRGEAYFNLKDYDNALISINESINQYTQHHFAYFIRGLIYINRDKNYDLAIQDFKTAIDIRQTLWFYYSLEAYAYYRKAEISETQDALRAFNEYEKAITLYKKAYELMDKNESRLERILWLEATVLYAEEKRSELLRKIKYSVEKKRDLVDVINCFNNSANNTYSCQGRDIIELVKEYDSYYACEYRDGYIRGYLISYAVQPDRKMCITLSIGYSKDSIGYKQGHKKGAIDGEVVERKHFLFTDLYKHFTVIE